MNPLELPEIVAHVFDQLPLRDVFTCLLVCRAWYAEANRATRWPTIDRICDIVLNDLKIIPYTEAYHKWVSCYASECAAFTLHNRNLYHHIITPKRHIHDRMVAHVRKYLRHHECYTESDDVLFSVYPGTILRSRCLNGNDQTLLAEIARCGILTYDHWSKPNC